MITGKKSASEASRILRDPKSTKKEKEAAASNLSQVKRHAPPQPAKRPR